MYPYFDPQFAEYDYLYDMYIPPHILPERAEEGFSRAGSISIVGVDTHPAGLARWPRDVWVLMEDIALVHEGRQCLALCWYKNKIFLVSLPSRFPWRPVAPKVNNYTVCWGIHCTNLFRGVFKLHT